MNKLLTIPALILMTLVSTNIFAEKRPDISEYAFEKNILIKTYDKEVKISLDKDILRNVKSDFSNFAIFNSKNEDVPFDVYIEDFKQVKDIEVVEVSSMREFDGIIAKESDIADDNHFTIFNFSERIDRKNPSWVILDLKNSVHLGRMEIFLPTREKINFVEVKGGNSIDDLKTIIGKKAVKPIYNQLNLYTPSVRFVKVSFWGVNVRVEDIELTTAKNGYIYFTPKSGEKYYAKYGNTNLNFFKYSSRLEKEKDISEEVYFSNQKWNGRVKKDLDGDGIDNEEDNCPFIDNGLQRDSDEDGIGNDCDNAPETKNYDQSDIDEDGVGDIVDNCELYPNPDQANKDGDEYGDVCDGADSDNGGLFNSKVLNKNISSGKGLFVGFILIIILAYLGFTFKDKILKKK
jgi:hypothetical protein